MASRIKTAFITGIAGQDGAYLAQLLLSKGYCVHGLIRWDSYSDPLHGFSRLDDLGLVDDDIHLHMGDLTDATAMVDLIKRIQPDEIYNLAAMSQVAVSFETPGSTFDINAKGPQTLFEAVRILDMVEDVRIYQASSSEMFGCAPAPQNEQTPFDPSSPYGVAKVAGYMLARMYRKTYGMHISNGILFNHESPLRGEDFVTRKITKAVASIESGSSDVLKLGNLDSKRDWGHARDYVDGMWRMLQQDHGDDYVLATGEAFTVRDFVNKAFSFAGITIEWVGLGSDEIGRDPKTKKTYVSVDPKLFRPKDVDYLMGDATKARKQLGWTAKTTLDTLVSEMMSADRRIIQSKFLSENIQWQKAG
ncbi:MAG: GDP-mannose 4,6-dehydratase [Alphaproteobacteria bacterium]|nr:GDP-mannose 4,6-dehydratase [Alphaproteobacteria bacterium]